MIEETGVVVAVHGDLAEIESRRKTACGSCTANGDCGTSLLERYFGRRPLLLTVRNRIGAGPGESVVIGVPEQQRHELSIKSSVGRPGRRCASELGRRPGGFGDEGHRGLAAGQRKEQGETHHGP